MRRRRSRIRSVSASEPMRWRKRTNQITGFLVVLPSIVLIAVFVYGFIGRAVWASLTDWGKDPSQALALNPVTRFIGLQNYRELFTGLIDGRFRQDMVSTVFFTLFFLAGCLLLGLVLAILIDHKPRGEGFFRGVFLFPFALSFVVTGTIWRWLLQPGGGVNVLPTLVGLPPARFAWLTSRSQVWRFEVISGKTPNVVQPSGPTSSNSCRIASRFAARMVPFPSPSSGGWAGVLWPV